MVRLPIFGLLALALTAGSGCGQQISRPHLQEWITEGFNLVDQQKYQEAEKVFREVRKLDAGNQAALNGMLDAMMRQGKRNEAVAMLQAEAAARPSRRVQHLLGNTAVVAGKYELAIVTFQGLLVNADTCKQRGHIYLLLGEIYRRKLDLETAIAVLQKAQADLPADPVVANTLAAALNSAGRLQEAIQQYRSALAIHPNNAVLLHNLGRLLADSGGDLDEALALAQRAHALLPNSSQLSDTLGWIYLKNHAAQAMEVFEQLVETEPKRSTFPYHLGMALAQAGNHFAAGEQLRMALHSNPDPEEAEKIKRLIEAIGQ